MLSFCVASYLSSRHGQYWVSGIYSESQDRETTYLFPLKAHIPQFPADTSLGSRSFKSHLRLLNRFSPGSSRTSNSPAHLSLTHPISLSISLCVYPVQMMGTLVSRSFGNVSAHSCELAGWPRPGWKSMKQSK